MSYTAIDLFAGGGGTTTGAGWAGVKVLWAANHKKAAVACHSINHPSISHVRQDLHQADWSLIPKHDITLASPCCQGHSKAAGKAANTKKADLSRSTAWAVVSCLDYHRSEVCLIENVECFTRWGLYGVFQDALKALGYSLSLNLINLAHLGGAQNRERLIIVATQSKNPIELKLEMRDPVPARSIIDLDLSKNNWGLVKDRSPKTQARIANGRKKFGDVFLEASYSGEKGGRSIDKPIGTITTVNKHYVVVGDYIRPITLEEMSAFQTFPSDYIWPTQRTVTKELIGNAVPPMMAKAYIEATLKAA